jgi:hypothetical protein
MQDFDDDISELTIEEFTELVHEDLPNKIDGCKHHIDVLDSKELFLKDRIKELTDAKKQVENAKKRFKEYLVFAMKSKKVDKVKGKLFNLAIQSRKSLSPQEFELTTDHFIELNTISEGCVKRSYSFDSAMFKKMCEKHPEIKDKYAVEKTSSFPMFRVRKDK